MRYFLIEIWKQLLLFWLKCKKFFQRKSEPEIELRDALTGKYLGMTKKVYKRYVCALGTKDEAFIMKVANEIRIRREQLNSK